MTNNSSNLTTFTADFIAEGLDQTRGRFRSLHILWHAIQGENAAKNIIVNGLILAEDGKKMSKSLKNYPDPQQLIEKRGGDSFRLHVLSSPVVRAEPMRFNEKDTEQAFKDFTLPLQNVFNFFETYAKIDNRKSDGTEVRFMRHAEAEKEWELNNFEAPLNANGEASLESKEFIEKILRINPDIIIDNEFLRVQKTAESAQRILKEYANKEIEIISPTEDFTKSGNLEPYQELLQHQQRKRILIVSNKGKFTRLRSQLYGTNNTETLKQLNNLEVIELPTYQLTNDLDKRILAELNKTMKEVDTHLQNYILDEATKSATDFMDKLTNRRLRRSRRRFRSKGMNTDKHAAYATFYRVLKRYLQILAPFAPFITEHLWLELANFTTAYSRDGSINRPNDEWNNANTLTEWNNSDALTMRPYMNSIHLSYRPIANDHYINPTLIEEIATVRKIIKLALFIRAKNKIAVKQPLQKLSLA